MTNRILSGVLLFSFIPAVFLTTALFAQTDLELKLARDVKNYELNDFTRVEAAFILSGAQEDSLDYYLDWYQSVKNDVEPIAYDLSDPVASANRVFSYLHSRWLKTYQLEATTLLDVVNRKVFNCVSATILFNLLCDDLGWTTEAFETPTHVLTIFDPYSQKILVENTSPMGFQIVKNLQAYSRHLMQFYPENQAAQIGFDRIYLHEQNNGRVIDNTELLGLLAYNRAYFARKRGDHDQAYAYVRIAQRFNKDSRSNRQFEIGLYYEWGGELAQKGQIGDALDVFLQASERYPNNPDFQNNARAAFFQSLSFDYQKKDWPNARDRTQEMIDWDLLKDGDANRLAIYFSTWNIVLKQRGEEKHAGEAAELFRYFSE